jgi:hypothetical protein
MIKQVRSSRESHLRIGVTEQRLQELTDFVSFSPVLDEILSRRALDVGPI